MNFRRCESLQFLQSLFDMEMYERFGNTTCQKFLRGKISTGNNDQKRNLNAH